MEPDEYLQPGQTGSELYPPLVDAGDCELITAVRERLAEVLTVLSSNGDFALEGTASALRDPESKHFVICTPKIRNAIMFNEALALGCTQLQAIQVVNQSTYQTAIRLSRNNQILITDLPVTNFSELHYLTSLAYVLADELIPQYRDLGIKEACQVTGMSIANLINHLDAYGLKKAVRSKVIYNASGRILGAKPPDASEIKLGSPHDYVIQDLIRETFMLQTLYTDWLLQQGEYESAQINPTDHFQRAKIDFINSVQFRSQLTPDNYHLISLLDFVATAGTFNDALGHLIRSQLIANTGDQATNYEAQAIYQVVYDRLACQTFTELIKAKGFTNKKLAAAFIDRDISYFQRFLQKHMPLASEFPSAAELKQIKKYGQEGSLRLSNRDYPQPLHKIQIACAQALQYADKNPTKKLLQRVSDIMQILKAEQA